MVPVVEPKDFIGCHAFKAVVDVRSPGEFTQGHISGAINVPLFSDAERAVIGTLYVKTGKDEAIIKGLDIALPQTKDYIEAVRDLPKDADILVHCWRGGLRSAMMAGVFSRAGYKVTLLAGGYKAYRREIRRELARPQPVLVLGGYTGSGKTGILTALERLGRQVIDLEGLACHKGSVFGALGQTPQPTNEQFENDLFQRWNRLDRSKPVWLEDESRMIGNITLPDPVIARILQSKMVRIRVDRNQRIERLVRDYACFEKTLLSDAIHRTRTRMGGTEMKMALDALDAGDFHTVADLMLQYYDKAYQFAVNRRSGAIFEVGAGGNDPDEDARTILEFVAQNQIDPNEPSIL